jgi:hypothetical protein
MLIGIGILCRFMYFILVVSDFMTSDLGSETKIVKMGSGGVGSIQYLSSLKLGFE